MGKGRGQTLSLCVCRARKISFRVRFGLVKRASKGKVGVGWGGDGRFFLFFNTLLAGGRLEIIEGSHGVGRKSVGS